MDPATHIAHLRGGRGPAARRVPRGPARRRCPPARRGTAPRSSTTWPAPTRGTAPRWSTARATGFASSRAPRPPRATSCRAGTRPTCGAWSRRLSTMDTDGAWPTWAGDRPGIVLSRAAWPTRRRCTAGTRVGGAIDPALAVDGIDEHLGLFAPLAPGDAPPRPRHDPPPRHRHRGRVARAPSDRAASRSSTATPRATSRSAAAPATCCCGRGTGCRSTTASRCSATRPCSTRWRTGVGRSDRLRDRRRPGRPLQGAPGSRVPVDRPGTARRTPRGAGRPPTRA